MHETHSLYPFFRFFPTAAIAVTKWDIDPKCQEGIIRKYWWEFTKEELEIWNTVHKRSIFFTACDLVECGHTNNCFGGVRTYFIDIDVTEKFEVVDPEEVKKRKEKAFKSLTSENTLLRPSIIIETRNGYHAYWLSWKEEKMDADYAPEGGLYRASPEMFDHVEQCFVDHFKGDIRACKRVQLMRVPGFYNHKKGQSFMCKWLKELDYQENNLYKEYSDDEWIPLFGLPKPKPTFVPKIETKEDRLAKVEINLSRKGGSFSLDDVFLKAKNMRQDLALMKLSGCPEVNYERYEFVPVHGGNHLNILINGELCSSFIDVQSNALLCRRGGGKGSPNVIEWLKWEGYPKKTGAELAQILKNRLFS